MCDVNVYQRYDPPMNSAGQPAPDDGTNLTMADAELAAWGAIAIGIAGIMTVVLFWAGAIA